VAAIQARRIASRHQGDELSRNVRIRQTLEENMRDGVVSNSLVAFLRMLTSCEIELKSDFFAPFIMVRF